MSNVISGNGGGPWLGDFDVPWMCPDGGVCNHECPAAACWRVHNVLAPLRGVFPDDKWPEDVKARYEPGGSP